MAPAVFVPKKRGKFESVLTIVVLTKSLPKMPTHCLFLMKFRIFCQGPQFSPNSTFKVDIGNYQSMCITKRRLHFAQGQEWVYFNLPECLSAYMELRALFKDSWTKSCEVYRTLSHIKMIRDEDTHKLHLHEVFSRLANAGFTLWGKNGT